MRFKAYLVLRICAHEAKEVSTILSELPKGHYKDITTLRSLVYKLCDDGYLACEVRKRPGRGGHLPTWYETTTKGVREILSYEARNKGVLSPTFVFDEHEALELLEMERSIK